MAAADPPEFVCFPPLGSVVGLGEAPREVIELLCGAWMAVPASSPPRGRRFDLRWRPEGETSRRDLERAGYLSWEPVAPSGPGAAGCGRVWLSPDADETIVELTRGGLRSATCLEALLEVALGQALAAHGECLAHAAAVEIDGRRLLLTGDSGAGKSTLAVAVVAGGGRLISDDTLLLGLTEGRPVVRGARRDAWLRPGSDSLLPLLERRGHATERVADGRVRLDRRRSPEAFRDSTRPDRLVLLGRTRTNDDGIACRALSQAEGLAALVRATSSLHLTGQRFARRRRSVLELMTTFAEALPAVELEVGAALLESTEKSLAAILAALP